MARLYSLNVMTCLAILAVAEVIKSSVFPEVECETLILNILNAFQVA